jgi:dTDP-4-dehydrorhamnose 3,5-epimerase
MIDGVVVSPRRQLVDERGKIVHVLREDDPEFQRFGEVYFSWVNPGVVKGWHLHTAMTLNYTCPVGLVKLALWDDREGSPSRGEVMELFLGPDDHRLVTVPPGVWNGFKGVATAPSMVCNCATLPHDPEEIRRRDPFDPAVPYDWALRHG